MIGRIQRRDCYFFAYDLRRYFSSVMFVFFRIIDEGGPCAFILSGSCWLLQEMACG